MVGGAAYATGKHMERKQQAEYAQDQSIQDLQDQQQYAAPAAPPPPPPVAPPPAPVAAAPAQNTSDMVEALTQMKGLLDAGVLTQAEFDVQKLKILQGG